MAKKWALPSTEGLPLIQRLCFAKDEFIELLESGKLTVDMNDLDLTSEQLVEIIRADARESFLIEDGKLAPAKKPTRTKQGKQPMLCLSDVEGPAAPPKITQGKETMTQEKPEAFNNMFERLNRMTRKDCAQCGQVFQGLPETDSCLECQYKQDHPEDQDMYWTWKRTGPGGWGIVAHWPDREPPPNPGDQVSVHQKDGSSSTVIILKVGDLHYLPTGRARLECTVE